MSGHRTRRRRGHPKGKAYGFRSLHPATNTSGTDDASTPSAPSTPSTSTPSSPSTGD